MLITFILKLFFSYSPEIMDQDIDLDPDFVKLEKSLSDLVQSGTLHWRHHQMAIGMLLTLLVRESRPTAQVVNLWLENLLHDDVTIRFIAFQVRKIVLFLKITINMNFHVESNFFFS